MMRFLLLCLIWPWITTSGAEKSPVAMDINERLTIQKRPKLPARQASFMSGSAFIRYTQNMSQEERERAALREFARGNVPDRSRQFVPVSFHIRASIWEVRRISFLVASDYFAIGSNRDFVIFPLHLESAAALCRHYGFFLPTTKMVNDSYLQAGAILKPRPLPPSSLMTTNAYIWQHQRQLLPELTKFPSDALFVGHKKDVVFSNVLNRQAGRIAIYGWLKGPRRPIQPLSLAHYVRYADYSHGIRLVHELVEIDGRWYSLRKLLASPAWARFFTDEGPLHHLERMLFEAKG